RPRAGDADGGAARAAGSGSGANRRRRPVARSAPARRRGGLRGPARCLERDLGMIVATAGHIDHGKTALLEALTGHAGDRRREERERGITIDLGYQYADLGEGNLTGFIDVPGHERFVHNMLAGASGIDLVLLVVAA